ncbi:thioredoxin family protein [Actinoplanes sp. NPDC048988]|uniref:thioredoxin family protein n=1 Tax=Actinoplanes sp. NPDC048988 TaxID=3363901 RepID=UPI00371497CF
MDSIGLVAVGAVLLIGTAVGLWRRRTEGRFRDVAPATAHTAAARTAAAAASTAADAATVPALAPRAATVPALAPRAAGGTSSAAETTVAAITPAVDSPVATAGQVEGARADWLSLAETGGVDIEREQSAGGAYSGGAAFGGTGSDGAGSGSAGSGSAGSDGAGAGGADSDVAGSGGAGSDGAGAGGAGLDVAGSGGAGSGGARSGGEQGRRVVPDAREEPGTVEEGGAGAEGVRLGPELMRELGVEEAKATLLQFSSAFCAPCRAVRRVSSEVAAMVPGVRHVEVDAESHLEAVRALGIWRTPTLLVLDGEGRIAKRATGVPGKPQLIAALGAVL